MLPASNKGVGMCIGMPDVCLTPAPPGPPVPVPYPNIGLNAQAAPFSPVVKVSMVNALNTASQIPITAGDEAGVAHPVVKGPARYTMGNPVVHVDSLPGINLLCPTTGNNANNALGAVLVPSVTNVFFTHDVRPPLEVAALERLAETLRSAPAGTCGGDGITWVAVPVFGRDASTRLHGELRRAAADGVTALVLDLRGCPGGVLDAALELADDFLEKGAILATRIDPDGDALVLRARRGTPYSFPLLCLVDRRTASAAELFVGALRAHGRALVVGERTRGKGTAQTLLPGHDEPGLSYATVARFLLPDGRPLDGVGIDPDIAIDAAGAEARERALALARDLARAPTAMRRGHE
jgi:carboxyl-terminal processing protease